MTVMVICGDVVPAVVPEVSVAGGLVLGRVEVEVALAVPMVPAGCVALTSVGLRLVTVTAVPSVPSARNSFNFSLILKMPECKNFNSYLK